MNQDTWLYQKSRPFCYAGAWWDLIQMADNGRVRYSQRGLAERWGWSQKKVFDFLWSLEQKQMIEVLTDREGSILRIFEFARIADGITKTYDWLESSRETESPMESPKESPRTAPAKANKENGNHQENGLFLKFWESYPRKTGKGAAEVAFEKIIPPVNEGLLNAMLSTLAWEKKTPDWKRERGQFIPLPATWLNQKRWMDEPPRDLFTEADPHHLPTRQVQITARCVCCHQLMMPDDFGSAKLACSCRLPLATGDWCQKCKKCKNCCQCKDKQGGT